MLLRDVPCGIVAVGRIGVGEADDGFHTLIAQYRHILVKRIEHGAGQGSGGFEVIQVVMHQDNRHAFRGDLVIQGALFALDRVRLGGRQMTLEHRDETTLRVGEDSGVIRGVVDGGCGQNNGTAQGCEREKKSFHSNIFQILAAKLLLFFELCKNFVQKDKISLARCLFIGE